MLPWIDCGENIIVEVKNVKFKKENGTLFVTINRIVWTHVEKPNLPFVQYEYGQIKAQRISPDSAAKVRLQLVLHDDTAVTFHFNNPSQELQKAERERVKEVLVQLLQQSKKKQLAKEEPSKKQINKELEMKQKILQSSEEMYIMYKTLVSGGIISAEDFWSIPQAEEMLSNEKNVQQSSGVTSAFMSEARPEVDGCNSIQYNLTAEIIQSIFHTYPMIKRKHQEVVPDKMDEREFWTKFFQSQYFHRDRTNNKNNSKNDLFSNLAQEDEETSLQKLLMSDRDPLLDISDAGESSKSDGYGMLQADNDNPGSKPLIRKYHHHSFMICQNFSKPDINKKAIEIVKQQQLKEMTRQSDLMDPKDAETAPLNLTKQFYSKAGCKLTVSKEEAMRALEKTKFDVKNCTLSSMHESISSECAFDAINHMTDACEPSNQANKLPKPGSNVMEEVRLCYLNASQILRHFWLCFPVTNSTLEDKVNRMAESILKYKNNALEDTFKNLPPKDTKLLKHLNDQLDLALRTHSQWISKKGRR